MKEQILKLRSEGKTYNEIARIIGCSKGTISYHCGKGQKEKSLKRQRKNRDKLSYKLYSKVDSFSKNKIRNFKRGKPHSLTNSDIKYKEAYLKLIENPYCYLTGRKIDLEDVYSYQLDHIIPYSKGGKNTLNNMGLTCTEANKAKSDMLLKDFIKLCIEIAEKHKTS